MEGWRGSWKVAAVSLLLQDPRLEKEQQALKQMPRIRKLKDEFLEEMISQGSSWLLVVLEFWSFGVNLHLEATKLR
jgi:hypothetical protein